MKKNTPVLIAIIVVAIIFATTLGMIIAPIFIEDNASNNTNTSNPTETVAPPTDVNNPTGDNVNESETELKDGYFAQLTPTNNQAKQYPFKNNVFPLSSEYFENVDGVVQYYRFAPSETYISDYSPNATILNTKLHWDGIKDLPLDCIKEIDGEKLLLISSSVDSIPNGAIRVMPNAPKDSTIGDMLTNGYWVYSTMETTYQLNPKFFFDNPSADYVKDIIEAWGMPTLLNKHAPIVGNYTYSLTYQMEDLIIVLNAYEKLDESEEKGIINVMICGQNVAEDDVDSIL